MFYPLFLLNRAVLATAVLDCASQYHTKPDGLLPYALRPELLRAGAIARIPPMPPAHHSPPSGGSRRSHHGINKDLSWTL
ncbi:DUF1636 family protein [Nostoc sp.]|uniref:DUF1636 family protein n=1 Tax=Nostoc sp. TaxID=1180 RepID=UPI002FEE97EC